MIMEVLYDMRAFMTVLFITIIAFANGLFILSLENEKGD